MIEFSSRNDMYISSAESLELILFYFLHYLISHNYFIYFKVIILRPITLLQTTTCIIQTKFSCTIVIIAN